MLIVEDIALANGETGKHTLERHYLPGLGLVRQIEIWGHKGQSFGRNEMTLRTLQP